MSIDFTADCAANGTLHKFPLKQIELALLCDANQDDKYDGLSEGARNKELSQSAKFDEIALGAE